MVYTHVYMKNAHEKLKEFVFRVPCYGISANIICLHFVIH